MSGIYLLSGSNLPPREEWLAKAISFLQQHKVEVIQTSKIYQTAAWGFTEQPHFLNQVVRVEYSGTPQALLAICQQIEEYCERIRVQAWGPRTLDLDILYFNNEIVNTPQLTIPHAFIQFRRFALVPLVEIADDFVHPVLKQTNRQLLQDCADKLPVEEYIV